MSELQIESIDGSKLDKFNYYGDFVQLPIFLMVDFLYLAKYAQLDSSVLCLFIAGILFYGALLEYGFHRFLYHGKLKQIKKLHLIHHKLPQSYVSSPPYVTTVLLLIFYIIFTALLGNKLGCAFVAGITFGYLWYISIHHLIHHAAPSESKFLNHFKEEHQKHHDHAKLNYCVSQPFWNTFYRTLGKYHR
ncbi:MAG: hypothetical protein EPN84_06675 [Legionella sp.]|nr:MAG: hypothetical protein EPN84_06675 [Legionella sp.]